MNILLVEDRTNLAATITDYVRSLGHSVDHCTNANDGFNLYKQKQHHLVFLDMKAAGISAEQFCRNIRLQPGGDLAIILVATDHSTVESLKSVLNSGADDFLTNPIDLNFLGMRLAIAERLSGQRIERAKLEAARLDAETGFRHIFENAVEGMFQCTPDGKLIAANPSLARMFGVESPANLMTESFCGANKIFVDAQKWKDFRAELDKHGTVRGFEAQCNRLDGTTLWASISVRAIFDSKRDLIHYEGSAQDITERKNAEAALNFSADQLRQSQKIEAIGRLAGGVAHDFNNLLMVIIGRTELLLSNMQADNPARANIVEINTTAERAAELTQQLLAFSRRQIHQPRNIDLNAVVTRIDSLLRRLIGEDISLDLVLSREPGVVRADPSQLEQVLMNLAVNARDAMPSGGKLLIATRNVDLGAESSGLHPSMKPGMYVLISVIDTGTGMDEETQGHIFEPFFTTKPTGEGTGLGLSTVYGIVKQSDGFIFVSSQLGKGARFDIYLPRMKCEPTPLRPVPAEKTSARGTETILLVEDEDGVRQIIQESLQESGYSVLTANGPEEAAILFEQNMNEIQLLVTDVIMPGGNGRDLAHVLTRFRPDLLVLFITGYAESIVLREDDSSQSFEILQKPFTPDRLQRRVRQMLDRTV